MRRIRSTLPLLAMFGAALALASVGNTVGGRSAHAASLTHNHPSNYFNCNVNTATWDHRLGLNLTFTMQEGYICADNPWFYENAQSFQVCGSSQYSYVNAQGDVWLTQQPYTGGHRISESGRSPVVSYPNNCYWYAVTNTYINTNTYYSPLWGCGWFQLPNYSYSQDYDCADMI